MYSVQQFPLQGYGKNSIYQTVFIFFSFFWKKFIFLWLAVIIFWLIKDVTLLCQHNGLIQSKEQFFIFSLYFFVKQISLLYLQPRKGND
jgi:hypothetical protein